MNTTKKNGELLTHSTLDMAGKYLVDSSRLTIVTLFLPVPLIILALLGFFYFQPNWYIDPFMWAILGLFTFGQCGALLQLISLHSGSKKAKKTVQIIRNEGDQPDLENLQSKMLTYAPSCHIRDNVLRWIQLGMKGETEGLERMMEHAAVRRDQTAVKIMSFHSIINRITLKLGFLGTLIGLMMTFDPMKQAMLSLKGSEGEFRFINDICKAIDGDAYAIVTTLFATGLSVFIELLTIQIFERILSKFEMVNNNLDDWCIIHLQPWIRLNYGDKNSNDGLVELQKAFAQNVLSIQKTLDEQLRTVVAYVQETGKQITSILPLQQDIGVKIGQLAEFEKQYRQFITQKINSLSLSISPTRQNHE